ncbi:MAPEG family protein [Pseudoxanthomonas suwonensis]|jgi:Uncharacterized relative of glutathione S-transferase, MAPEG superfamily|uniref:MAPEG family protein n=1 Tax=Pseudoxanthomonas suwonensis TaxID=314722 RepID=UPI0004662991|nr:MAPEG family protein [Pseudoxanthomonas suwonensis]
MAVTPRISLLVASLHLLLFLYLSLRVMLQRRSRRIGIGAGGDLELERRIRVHANFAEYVPLGLLVLALLELSGTRAEVLWTFGLALLGARLMHAAGLGGSSGYSAGRAGGAALTMLVLAGMGLLGLWRFIVEATL